ncbi:MAG: DUF1311 domain-containing protein [Herbaspirillum sp.]|nr:DUF1311 domain-containing protein [Herbaspirillum sp.]
MGNVRDIIQEISDVRQRRQFGTAIAELPSRLSSINNAFSQTTPDQHELRRYFPVALIGCLEGYFRMAIRDLIDSGEPFLSNADKLLESTKLDFSLVRAIHGKTITVGELIAHNVPLSRLAHIEKAFKSLIGADFLNELRTVQDRWAHEVLGQTARPILLVADTVFKDVERTFELRHIICHEIASAYVIDAEEIARCFENCVLFLKAADEFISGVLHPNAPLTQTEMNIAAGESLERARDELNVAIENLRSNLDDEELAFFDQAQIQWLAYAEAWTLFEVGERKNSGTIWPLLYARSQEYLVSKRVEDIRKWRRFGE